MTTITSGFAVSTKPIEVPQILQDGEKFIKWDEESGAGIPVTLRVDPKGFFLYWTDQNMEVEMLDIATISDVRTGQYARLPKDGRLRSVVSGIGSAAGGALEDKTVTVAHGLDFVNVAFVNFCCARADIAQAWTAGLFSLAYNVHQSNCSALRALEKLHARLALRADKERRVPVKNIVRQFAAGKEERRRVEKALAEAGLPAAKGDFVPLAKFAFEDFFAFYKCLTQRREVQAVFDKLSEGKPALGAAALVEFLNEVQRDPRLNEILHPYADVSRARELVRQHEPNKYLRARDQLSPDGFLRFLLSGDNPAVAPQRLDLCDDMDQPLAHYFINSSHNTYLTGHQITGKSSVEMYRQSLLAGCRCVELDFWNGRTEEPVVVHGYTFVPEVPARDVLEAIAESAFKTSDFPVILSFENHCNPRQQAKIAGYCRDIFRDMLLDRPLDSHPLEPGGELPSPWALRRKIIIKNKKKHHHHHKREPPAPPADVVPEEAPAPAASTASADEAEAAHAARLARHSSKESITSSSSASSSGGEEEEEGVGAVGAAGVAAAAAPAAPSDERETHAGAEISALVNYVQPVHFTSFENAEKKNRFYEMSSFDEKQATTLLKERPVEFVNYNKAQLSRVYPAGTRFDSSNFMPQVFWNAGCQLVALNYQTPDLAMQLNLAAFEYNLRCGYLLKPEWMRRRDTRLDPFAESTVDGIVAGAVSVAVLSGQLLSERRGGVYVEVDLFGLPADTVRKRFRTRTQHNALNPVFDDEPFVFKKVVLPELAWLRLAAHEEGGRLLGHRALPLAALRPGYRHVTLRTELGRPTPAALLLRLTVADYVPDTLSELAEALANPIKYQSELDKREQQLRVLVDDGEPTAPGAAPPAAVPPPAPPAPVAPLPPPATAAATAAPAPPPGPPDEEEEEVQALLQCRAARQQRAELARKLDALRRKQARSRFSTHKLVKRLSALNISGSGEGGGGGGGSEEGECSGGGGGGGDGATGEAAERELRLRYHQLVYAALDKHARHLHQQQMKELSEQLEAEKKELLARLALARKEDVRALGKRANRDKDEVLRIKREIDAQSVERGVLECSRLEGSHKARRERLAARHERARARLNQLRDMERAQLDLG